MMNASSVRMDETICALHFACFPLFSQSNRMTARMHFPSFIASNALLISSNLKV